MFHGMDELTTCVRRLGLLLDTLTAMGMTVNDKTVALMRMTGKMVRQAQSRHIIRNSQGAFLRIPRSDGSFTHVRLVARHTYLGAIVSYSQFESLTLAHRLKSATKSAMLLHVWLRGKGGLSRTQRATVWVQCIFTCVVHSLLSVGLTSSGLLQLDRFCLLQLRKIFEQPVRLDHVTHKQFLQSHRLKDPLSLLRRRCCHMMKRNQLRKSKASPDDIFATWSSTHIATQLRLIEQFIHQRRSSFNIPSQPFTFHCDQCSKAFPSLAELRRHHTREHNRRSGLSRPFDFLQDVKDGVPTCRRCLQHFTPWKELKHHVMFVCLAPLPQDDAERRKFHDQQSQFLRWADEDLTQMDPDSQLCASFCVRCAVCNKFCNCLRSMKYHHLVDHPTAHAAHAEILMDLTQRAGTTTLKNCPCKFCCVDVKKRHDCIILRQLAMLIAHSQTTDEPLIVPYTTAADQPTYACDVCQKQFLTKHGLELHKLTHQKTDSSDDNFDLCRDALPGKQCAHCLRKFPAMPALERHIRTGACNSFDKNKARTTMLDSNADLKKLYDPADFSHILLHQSLRIQLKQTCILCNNYYARVHSLQKHIITSHPHQWKQAEQEAEDLFLKHTSSLIKCYCEPKVNTKKHHHRCVIFKQLAMLHTMQKTATRTCSNPDMNLPTVSTQVDTLNSTTLIVPPAGESLRVEILSDTDDAHYVRDVRDADSVEQAIESTTDQALADMLAAHIDCTDDAVFSATQVPPLELTDELYNELHLAFVDHAPTAIYHILAGDLTTLMQDSKVHNFMNRFCTMCNCAFEDFHAAEAHFKQHWCSFGFPSEEFDPSLQLFLHGLSAHSWFRSSNSELCLFLQCFVLRFLAAHLATCHERGRLEVTEASPRRSDDRSSAEQAAERERERERKRSRSRSRSAAADPEIDQSRSEARRSDQSPHGGIRVHTASGTGTGRRHGANDAAEPTMAPRSEQIAATPTGAGMSTHGDSAATGHCTSSISSDEHLLENCSERGHHHGPGDPSLPDLVPQESITHPDEEGPIAHEGGDAHPGGDPVSIQVAGHGAQISLPEKDIGGRGTAGNQERPMDAGDRQQSPSNMLGPSDPIELSQYLAARPSKGATSVPEAQRTGQCLGLHESRHLIRICVNHNGLCCYLNSIFIGLCWMALKLGAISDDIWTDQGRAFHAMTTWTPLPINLWSHSAFHDLMQSWGKCCNLQRQQDAAEALHHFLQQLRPSFYGAQWLPLWVLNPTEAAEHGGEKGVRFATLHLNIHHVSEGSSLQQLIETWRDHKGHCRVITSAGPGICLHLDRPEDEHTQKICHKHVLIDDQIRLPCVDAAGQQPTWTSFDVHAAPHFTMVTTPLACIKQTEIVGFIMMTIDFLLSHHHHCQLTR